MWKGYMRWTGPSVLAFVLVVVLTTSHGAEAGPQTSHRGTLRRALTNSSAVVPDKQQDPACPTDGEAYDYIVVGGGPAGIIVAERLSTAHKVLLLEEGEPGLASNGAGQWRLGGPELYPICGDGSCTMFDVLGCYENLWDVKDAQGHMAVDVHEPHILGGASTINGGLWFVPPAEDLDRDWPSGWKAADVMPYYDRVRQRLTVTNRPSADKRLYNQEYYEAVAEGLKSHGWREVADFNGRDAVNGKYDKVFGHPSFLNKGGLRDTPARTYLADAQARPTFRLVTGAAVSEVMRQHDQPASRGRAIGVAYSKDGRSCAAMLRAGSGAVVVSAGAIGTPRVLFKSGIGPRDQVSVVSAKDHVKDDTWIEAPAVGANLFDTPLVPVQVTGNLPAFRHDCRSPHPDDAQLFTSHRSGPYASSGPVLMGWTERINQHGKTKYYEATLVPHPFLPPFDRPVYSLNLYLCNPDSRVNVVFDSEGHLALPPDSLLYRPGTSDFDDMAAWVAELVNSTTSQVGSAGLRPSEPAGSDEQSVKDFMRRSSFVTNHWGGSMRLGDATDLDLRVIGTENIYVADASVFPAPVRVNPQATVMMVAERLADKLLRRGL